MPEPVRCAIVPPVPVPYREPLFARLAERGRLLPLVIYQAATQPGWDQRAEWFPREHPYASAVLRSWQRNRDGRTPIMIPRDLGRKLSCYDPSCVVSWEYGPATLRALAWCALRRRPLVVFSELTPDTEGELSSAGRRLHRLVAPRAAGFVVASSAGRERLAALGVPRSRVEVSLQSADVERQRAAAAARRPRGGPVRVLTIGRLVPDKNLPMLLDAWRAAGLEPTDAELELVGTGPLEAQLRDRARSLGIPVRFRGYVDSESLPNVYAEADAVALVSTHEPFGVTMREGAAAELPLICSRRAGAAGDVAVEGENALLIDPESRSEIAEALGRVVRDRGLRERLAAGSRAVTERHPPEADVEAWERAVLSSVALSGEAQGAALARRSPG